MLESQQQVLVLPPVNIMVPQTQAMSSLRSKHYIKVSKTTRRQIISKLIDEGLSLNQVSEMFKVNLSTCRVILNTYKESGRIGKKLTRKTKLRIDTTVNFSILNPLTGQTFEILPHIQNTDMFVEKNEWALSCNKQLATILKDNLQDSLNSTIKIIHLSALQNRSVVGLELLNSTFKACSSIQLKIDNDFQNLFPSTNRRQSNWNTEILNRFMQQQAFQQANFSQMQEEAQKNSLLQFHHVQNPQFYGKK